MTTDLHKSIIDKYRTRFGAAPTVVAYAPGRVEVLGNHTDYNEGFVLSAAINYGLVFAAGPNSGADCLLTAPAFGEEASFPVSAPTAGQDMTWANYVKGVVAKLAPYGAMPHGFNAVFDGTLPIGAGLSSSAALEVAAALALCNLYAIERTPLELARACQAAEHEFAGAKCGLLDQISSLYGRAESLILSDFRTLDVQHVPLGAGACFVVCNTHATHNLVDSEYNERRARCEQAATHLATALAHPVAALRDITMSELDAQAHAMDATVVKRARHVIGENERVLKGRVLLEQHSLTEFGSLMYRSHESSQANFENSCPELDFIVDTARDLPGVLGARLSGGGFGGSALLLTDTQHAAAAGTTVSQHYKQQFGHPCDVLEIQPSNGAHLL